MDRLPPQDAQSPELIIFNWQEFVAPSGKAEVGVQGDVWFTRRIDASNTPVAIKMVRLQADADATELSRVAIERDLKVLAQVRHPNICMLMGVTYRGNVHSMVNLGLVQAFVDGGDLEAVLTREKLQPTLPLATRMRYLLDAARGMEWLHACKPDSIIHRDLKPANLLLHLNGTVCVADFGLYKAIPAGSSDREIGTTTGSPKWMSPEVLSCAPFDTKTDVYAFGLMLWQFLCREPTPIYPCNIRNKAELTDIVVRGFRPIIPMDCPWALRNLIEACWKGDPALRPPFSEIIVSLTHIVMDLLLGEHTTAPNDPQFEAPYPMAKRFWITSGFTVHETQRVDFHLFTIKLLEFLGIKPRELPEAYAKGFLRLCEHFSGSKGDTVSLTLGNFGDLLGWFGPLIRPDGRTIFHACYDLACQPWFCWALPGGAAENACSASVSGGLIQYGTYLVRFSGSESRTRGVFTLTYYNGSYLHQRICFGFDANGKCWFTAGDGTSYPTLEALLYNQNLLYPIPAAANPVLRYVNYERGAFASNIPTQFFRTN